MSAKYLLPAILVSLLAGCASTTVATTGAPDRIRIASPAGTLMTDGHAEPAGVPAGPAPAARPAAAVPPSVSVMTDATAGANAGLAY